MAYARVGRDRDNAILLLDPNETRKPLIGAMDVGGRRFGARAMV